MNYAVPACIRLLAKNPIYQSAQNELSRITRTVRSDVRRTDRQLMMIFFTQFLSSVMQEQAFAHRPSANSLLRVLIN